LYWLLDYFGTSAFAYKNDERIIVYSNKMQSLLKNNRTRIGTLKWLNHNLEYVTGGVIDSLFADQKIYNDIERRYAIQLISAFFGFKSAKCVFSNDVESRGAYTFPIQEVKEYWDNKRSDVMEQKRNLRSMLQLGDFTLMSISDSDPQLTNLNKTLLFLPYDIGVNISKYRLTNQVDPQ